MLVLKKTKSFSYFTAYNANYKQCMAKNENSLFMQGTAKSVENLIKSSFRIYKFNHILQTTCVYMYVLCIYDGFSIAVRVCIVTILPFLLKNKKLQLIFLEFKEIRTSKIYKRF